MSNLTNLIHVPSPESINSGLNSPHNDYLLELFGNPGQLGRNCAPITGGKIKRLVETQDVGPFRATGITPALASLKILFAKVKIERPDIYDQVKTAGMACCRGQRPNPSIYSNHSFGCAIDIYFGAGVVPQGDERTQQGVLDLYPYFHANGWYWGAEFGHVDAMHYEVSTQKLREWHSQGLI